VAAAEAAEDTEVVGEEEAAAMAPLGIGAVAPAVSLAAAVEMMLGNAPNSLTHKQCVSLACARLLL